MALPPILERAVALSFVVGPTRIDLVEGYDLHLSGLDDAHWVARAVEDTDVLEFDGNALLKRCEEDPKFGYELFKRFTALMSERLEAARQKMMDQWNPPGFA